MCGVYEWGGLAKKCFLCLPVRHHLVARYLQTLPARYLHGSPLAVSAAGHEITVHSHDNLQKTAYFQVGRPAGGWALRALLALVCVIGELGTCHVDTS